MPHSQMLTFDGHTLSPEFLALTDALPGCFLILLPDVPHFTIVQANDCYLKSTFLDRQQVIGKPLFETLTDNTDDPEATGVRNLSASLNHVLRHKEQHRMSDQRYDVWNAAEARFEKRIWQPLNKPVLNDSGTIRFIIHSVEDITEKVQLKEQEKQAREALEISRQRTVQSLKEQLDLFELSPVAIAVISSDNLIFRTVNSFFGALVDRKPEEITGRSFLEALPELAGQGFEHLMNKVIESGEPFLSPEVAVLIRRGDGMTTIFVNLACQPMRERDGTILNVFVIATDVTFQVLDRKRVAENEIRFRAIIEEAPVATCLFTGPEMKIEVANQKMIDVWGKGPSVLGLPLAEALPELKGQHFLPLLDDLFHKGESYEAKGGRADLVIRGELKTFYFDYAFKPLKDVGGKVYAIMEMAVDVTAQVKAQQNLEESELFARTVIDKSPVGLVVFIGREMRISIINQAMLAMLGQDESVIGLPVSDITPDGRKTSLLLQLQYVFDTGETYEQPEELVEITRHGTVSYAYYNFIYKALRNTGGEIYGVISTVRDITEHVTAIQRLEEAESSLLAAIELAQLGTWHVDLATRQVTYSTRLQQWLGIERATLQTDGSQLIMEADRGRVAASMDKILAMGDKSSFDEIFTVVHAKTSQKKILHAIGKARVDASGQPISISGTAQDITLQKQLQLALENEVRTRTEELDAAVEKLRRTNYELEDTNAKLMQSNEELSQYAYVASHDLQEPLRKIRIFTSMIQKETGLSQATADNVQKIDNSARRMSMLINDLLAYARVVKSDSLWKTLSLREVADDVVNDLELIIQEKGAKILIGTLPDIEAISLQMNQLFSNLIGNAVKFNRPDTPSLIQINSRLLTRQEIEQQITKPISFAQYYLITVDDNGIGFDMQYREQIFEVFKRLHNKNAYPGSGIGLALCRRIVDNHNGALYAESVKGKGTSFHVILPDRQHEIKAEG